MKERGGREGWKKQGPQILEPDTIAHRRLQCSRCVISRRERANDD